MKHIKDIVIFDIDGTLANLDARRPFIDKLPRNEQDWKSFLHDWNVIKDEPIFEIISLLQLYYYNGFLIYITSGRPDCLRDTTELWFHEHGIFYHELFMRKTGDHRKDDIIKEEFLNIIPKDRILLAVDDRQCVVDMWRRNGIKVLQCEEGNY